MDMYTLPCIRYTEADWTTHMLKCFAELRPHLEDKIKNLNPGFSFSFSFLCAQQGSNLVPA